MVALLLVNGAMAQWFAQSSTATSSFRSVFFINDSTGYIVGGDCLNDNLLKTNNGGTIWLPISVDSTSIFNSVYFPNPNTGYAVGNQPGWAPSGPGTLIKTTDGGITWTVQLIWIGGESINFNSVYFINADTGYVASCSVIPYGGETLGKILKTNDGGTTWTTKSIVTNPLQSVYFTDINTGYSVGDSGTIIKTTNGGGDWVALPSGTASDLTSVYFPDQNTGYAVGWNSTILKTNDGGLSWTQLSGGTEGYFHSVFFTDSNTGYVVGGRNSLPGPIILKTNNGGSNWVEQQSTINAWINSVFFSNNDTGYIVGDGGAILKTTNGGGFPVRIDDENTLTSTLTIYPNPTYSSITVETPGKGFLTILNICGQGILHQEVTEAKTTIDVSGLKCGVYFVRVVDNKNVSSGKFSKR